jgi:hypothetical protein
MKITRLLASFLFFSLGLMVVFISLVSANQVNSYEGTQASRRKFYLGQRILPDHILYPVVAAADRALLVAAPNHEKIRLKLAYGRIRFAYAQGLLDKGETQMAQAALTKSQKYYSLAAHQLLDENEREPVTDELKKAAIKQIENNIHHSQQLLLELSPDQRCLADQLNQQNKALLQKLQEI